MRLQFILSEIGIGLRRNLSITISVVLVTMVSLFFLGAGLLFRTQVDVLKDVWYDKIQISIFLCTANDTDTPTCAKGETTQAQRDQIRADLESLKPLVQTVYYESKQQAYQNFRQQFKDSALLDTVKPDELPDSFRVKLSDPTKYQVVSSAFTGRDGIREVQDQRELLDRLFTYLNWFSFTALVFAVVLLVCAVLLVAVTIRLSAFSRRRETGIMRLVGASNLFIQLPFMLEGVIAAALGAVLATTGLYAVVNFFLQGKVARALPSFRIVDTGHLWTIVPVLFVVAIVIAGVSSLITLRRYLRV